MDLNHVLRKGLTNFGLEAGPSFGRKKGKTPLLGVFAE